MGGQVSQASAQTGTVASKGSFVLEKVVTLGRHGVRPQTDIAALEKATGQSWPRWSVPDGYLTGHGYAGVVDQARYQLHQWQALGLPVSQGKCPAMNDVLVWAAPDQRTKATGIALLDGMFPGCGVVAQWSSKAEDPLFDANDMGFAKPDLKVVEQEVMARMGSSEAVAKRYQSAITTLRAAVCASGDSCKFLDKPWKIKTKDNGKLKLSGPVSEASSIAETIRLQYSENLPLDQVAFGHAPHAEAVRDLMTLHAAKYDLLSDTPEYARHGGSVLMRQMLNALTDGTGSQTSATMYPGLQRPLVMLVGHDTNIAQIQTMLGFNWTLPVYPRNDIPPGGSLNLERYRQVQTGQEFVRLTFTARTLDQWRYLTRLDAKHPLPVAEYQAPGCMKTSVGTLCPLADFVRHAQQQLVDDGKQLPVFQ